MTAAITTTQEQAKRFAAAGIQFDKHWVVTAWTALAVQTVSALLFLLSDPEVPSLEPLVVGMLLGLVAIVLTARKPTSPGTILITAGALTVQRKGRITTFPRHDLLGAHVVGDAVRITLKRHDSIVVKLELEPQVPELIAALDFGPHQRRNACELGNSSLSAVGCVAPMFGVAAALVGGLALYFLWDYGGIFQAVHGSIWLATTIGTAALTPWRRITVGVDGLWVETFLTGQFIPLVEVGPLRTGTLWHALARTNGRHVRLCWQTSACLPECRAVEARVRELQAAANNARPIPADMLSALERGSKPFERWVAEIRTLVAEVDDYRIAPTRLEALHLALLSPRSSVEQRLASAASLMAGEPSNVAAVRRAADCVARPATQRALLEVAEGRLTQTAIQNAIAP